MTTFDIIKELAEKNKISVVELEEKLGFSRNSLYAWKKSKPSVDKLQKVADYFDVSTDYLLGRTDTAKDKPGSSEPIDLDKALSDEGMAMFEGKPLSEEYKKALLAMLKANKNSGE